MRRFFAQGRKSIDVYVNEIVHSDSFTNISNSNISAVKPFNVRRAPTSVQKQKDTKSRLWTYVRFFSKGRDSTEVGVDEIVRSEAFTTISTPDLSNTNTNITRSIVRRASICSRSEVQKQRDDIKFRSWTHPKNCHEVSKRPQSTSNFSSHIRISPDSYDMRECTPEKMKSYEPKFYSHGQSNRHMSALMER